MKIGIIGSGISGLTAAYYLCREHQIEVFEANGYIGGHTNTIDVERNGTRYAVDTGFIVFNDRTYPGFCQLMDEIGVPSRPTGMTFSVRNDQTGLEYRGADLNGLFAQRRNLFRPHHYALLKEMLRFNRSSESLLANQPDSLTVNAFFERHPFSQNFLTNFFFPMASAIWSCPPETIGSFPIQFIVEFYRHHGLLSVTNRPQWRTIVGGSKQYIAPLTKRFFDNIHLNRPIHSVVRSDRVLHVSEMGGQVHDFDHLIFACHSDQALKILGTSATATEREILSKFPYEKNHACLHTDVSLLPRSRRAWAAWNYHLASPKHQNPGSAKATVTYNMNILQGIESETTFCVSLNSQHLINPHHIIREIEYDHPVFTADRRRYQQRHSELIDHQSVSYCGAYWGNGFHEDGVQSAIRVCQQLGFVY